MCVQRDESAENESAGDDSVEAPLRLSNVGYGSRTDQPQGASVHSTYVYMPCNGEDCVFL